MKNLIFIFALIYSLTGTAQTKYLTRTGNVQFEASVPSFEEVKATNTNSTVILNSENGEFAALVLVKGFRFKNALMEEHFNENYAESDLFPKATFNGTIAEFNVNKLETTPKIFTYGGTINFHGKLKSITNQSISISKNLDDEIILTGNFMVNVGDFKIKIPKVVSNKLSREISVSFEFELVKK